MFCDYHSGVILKHNANILWLSSHSVAGSLFPPLQYGIWDLLQWNRAEGFLCQYPGPDWETDSSYFLPLWMFTLETQLPFHKEAHASHGETHHRKKLSSWSPAPAKLLADSRLQVTSHVIESWWTWILQLPLEPAQPMLHIAENTYPSPDLQKLKIKEQNPWLLLF